MPTTVAPDPAGVRRLLEPHLLIDGYDLVLDLAESSGAWLTDALTKRRYLDLFSFFSSAPLGHNPPCIRNDPQFLEHLAGVAATKPSNPDVCSEPYATFVDTFARVLGDPQLPHYFFIDGGALAVENALKAAFDWKAQRLGISGPAVNDLQVLHLENAFHGRSGYTLSLTNTEVAKTALFPQFSWPRIAAPAVRHPFATYRASTIEAEERAVEQAVRAFDAAGDKIACFIAEPIQGEGGDNHFRPEFLQAIQQLCREREALFILDEVQTGCGMTGTAWAYQQLGLEPDIVAFGKKTQVCGVMAGRRIDEVPANVFAVSSRISSTWGGNLTDMVRATRLLETIERDHIFDSVVKVGDYLLGELQDLALRHPEQLSNPRGRGLMCAIDLPDTVLRDRVLATMFSRHQVIALACGPRGLRFRPPLTITPEEIDHGLAALQQSLNDR